MTKDSKSKQMQNEKQDEIVQRAIGLVLHLLFMLSLGFSLVVLETMCKAGH